MDHVNRVLEPALKFAQKENANKDIVSLLALFHNVDKNIFPIEDMTVNKYI